jgi:predicted HNH restriction endonuclease
MTNAASPPSKESAAVAELSAVLSRMARLLGVSTAETFRNANGVYMKMMNFRRLDPEFTGTGRKGLTRGNKDEAVVWDEFAGDRKHLSAVAAAIRAAVASDEAPALQTVDDEGIEEAAEGRILTRLHRSRERNQQLVETKKARALRAAGRLACEGCDFDFAEAYGKRGLGFMEAHHTRPVHEISPGHVTRLADLALVCANCHRMIHARRPWLTIVELRALVRR